MKIENKTETQYTLRLNSKEDFSFLNKIIEKGDIIRGRTYRKIKLSESDSKSRSVKKSFWIEIATEKVSVDDSVKVLGKTISENEDIPKNSTQSIDFNLSDEITIKKDVWRSYQKNLIDEAVQLSNKPRALICVIDDEVSTFANISYSGYTILGKNNLRLSKKRYIEQKSDKGIDKLVKKLIDLIKYYNSDYIILGSPLFWKEILKKQLVEEETELSNKIFLEDTTSGDEQSIREIYRGNTLDKIIKNNKLKRDEDLVDQYFEEISKRNDLVIYGKKTIIEASNNGKIEELIINDNIIEKNKELMNKVESFGGKIEILNSKTNSGMKLKGLSGMLAKKRFN